MRPAPRQRHVWAVLIMAVVVAANAAISSLEVTVSDSQANLLCEAYRSRDAAVLPNDTLFGQASSFWRLHTPAWRNVLSTSVGAAEKLMRWPGGIPGPQRAVLLLASLCLLLYLLSMYWLLYRQTRIWSISILVAVLSTAMFSARPPAWGVGPSFAVGPESLYFAIAPLIVMLLLRWRRSYASILAFLLAGLWGNLDLPSAVNLLLVMLIALTASRRWRRRAIVRGLLGLLAAAVGLAPAILSVILAYRSSGAELINMPLSDVRDALDAGGINLLYPDLLIDLLRFLSLAVVVGLPSVIVLVRVGRYRVRDLAFWLWMLGAVLFVSLALQGAMQLIALATGRVPAYLEFFPGISLAMLPLWVLFAQAMVSLIRLSRTHRLWTRLALAAFAVVLLACSRNVAPLRHRVDIAMNTPSAERHATALAEQAEIRAISRWAGTTGPGSLFLTSEAEIRYLGKRSIWASPPDVLYFLHLQPQKLAEFSDILDRQNELLHPSNEAHVDAAMLVAWAKEMRAGLHEPGDIYVVISSSLAPPADPHLRRFDDPGDQWGRYWRVYELLP